MVELNQKQIREILDQRYPFLLVDKILEIGEDYIIGLKNISASDIFLTGHFPENPVYPGVLLVETCTQVGGLLLTNHMQGKGYLAQIRNFKFIDFIVPGDTIIIDAKFSHKAGSFANVEAVAKVKEKIVGKGEIIYSFLKEK